MAKQSRIYSGNSLPLRPGLKALAIKLIESLPVIGDQVFARYYFTRRSTACRGVFESLEEAQAAVPAGGNPDYDACNESRSVAADTEREFQFEYEDYPVLFWMKPLIRSAIRIVDLGGSTGGTYYAFAPALGLPDDASWLVAELPGAVERGRKVAAARSESRIEFTTELGKSHSPDIFITLGTLQYMPQRLPEVLQSLGDLPKHLIVHKVPVTDGPAYWTLQNLSLAQVPYYIHNRDELVGGVEALGYRLVDQCDTLRQIRIPFHPARDVHHYSGLFFERI